MNILITGVNGFVGKHLAREVINNGHSVIGCGLDNNVCEELKNIVTSYYRCDLTNLDDIERLPLDTVDSIINLAGLAKVGTSFGKEDLYMKVNVRTHTNLCEAFLKLDINPRIISVSSGAVYDANQTMPINENGILSEQSSPYVMSKIAMEKKMNDYRTQGLDIIIARPFNHTGPGQLEGFIVPDLANQVLNYNEIIVGNLNTKRDYTDVRDVVRAYLLLATTPNLSHHTFNICSGKSRSGQEILNLILKKYGKEKIIVKVDQSKIRMNDPILIEGDNSLIRNETGWKPSISLEQTISDYIDSRA